MRSIRRRTKTSARSPSNAPAAAPVELQERAQPIARGRRQLRALERGLERGDHVELAAPGDRRAAGEVDRAELDRRPGQRADDRGGVVRIGERAQPGDRVADLGTAEEGGRPGAPERDVPLLERGGDQPALARGGAGEDADVLGPALPDASRLLDLAGDRLRLGPLVGAAPEPDRRLLDPRRPAATGGIGNASR